MAQSNENRSPRAVFSGQYGRTNKKQVNVWRVAIAWVVWTFPGLLIHASLAAAAWEVTAVKPSDRGFVSSHPAKTWEEASVSGNGRYGALVLGRPEDEVVILNHARLFLPLHPPLPPVDTALHLTEIRRMLAGGQYQRAADYVVELSHQAGWGEKRWTDPFIPAFDLRIKMSLRAPFKVMHVPLTSRREWRRCDGRMIGGSSSGGSLSRDPRMSAPPFSIGNPQAVMSRPLQDDGIAIEFAHVMNIPV
jgi:hypothetical protein